MTIQEAIDSALQQIEEYEERMAAFRLAQAKRDFPEEFENEMDDCPNEGRKF